MRLSGLSRKPAIRSVSVALLCGAALLGLGGCNSSPSPTFDLTAPRQGGGARAGGPALRGQIAVSEPATVQVFDGDQIIVKDGAGAVSYVSGGQWADRLPRLIQARLIQTFDNGPRIYGVSRPGGRIVADYQINSELRAFQINAATREAVVDLSVKLVDDRSGRILRSRVFAGRAPVGRIDAPGAAEALDRALAGAMLDIVRWTNAGG